MTLGESVQEIVRQETEPLHARILELEAACAMYREVLESARRDLLGTDRLPVTLERLEAVLASAGRRVRSAGPGGGEGSLREV